MFSGCCERAYICLVSRTGKQTLPLQGAVGVATMEAILVLGFAIKRCKFNRKISFTSR